MDSSQATELRSFSAAITHEDDWYVAQCLDVDIASQGATEDEALANLREALELYFETPTATDTPHVVQFKARIIAA